MLARLGHDVVADVLLEAPDEVGRANVVEPLEDLDADDFVKVVADGRSEDRLADAAPDVDEDAPGLEVQVLVTEYMKSPSCARAGRALQESPIQGISREQLKGQPHDDSETGLIFLGGPARVAPQFQS